MVEPVRTGALQRVREATEAELSSTLRRLDLERLPARRGEESIDAAIDRLLPTFVEVALAEAASFAMEGGSLPVESAASALGARSPAEMRLFVADWILRADLASPDLRSEDGAWDRRRQVFEGVCRRGFADLSQGRVAESPGIGVKGLSVILGILLIIGLIKILSP